MNIFLSQSEHEITGQKNTARNPGHWEINLGCTPPKRVAIEFSYNWRIHVNEGEMSWNPGLKTRPNKPVT